MSKSLMVAVAVLGVWGVTSAAKADGWLPFYGYRTPNYLAQPYVCPTYQYVVPVQGSGPQVVTSYYPPMEGTVVAPPPTIQYVSPPQCGGSRFYPFYGYRRPAYLDQ
jgi:hypothetical protein